MLLDLFISLLPICLAIALGMLAGKFLPSSINLNITRSIVPFVWLLLFAIGYKFGLVLENLKNVAEILKLASIFSIGLSFFVGVTLYFALNLHSTHKQVNTHQDLGIAHVLMECAWAFLSILAGVALAQLLIHWQWNTHFFPEVETFLYILLFMIGVDIINAPVNLKALNRRILIMPLLIMLGSTLGGVLMALIMGMDIRHGLVLSGGYGWFSLSGVMVTAKLGEFYGATSLLTDLFRELFSIVVLFFIGAKYPDIGIGTAGATGMDTTLPIIKRTAGNSYIAQALYIGAALSLIVPFWLAFLLSFF